MRALILFGLALVVSGSAVEVPIVYHDTIGIPTAERIKANEEAYFAKLALDDRIVGGALAPANAHPYFAGLLINFIGTNAMSVCGSSLLSHNRLVTAAHCWRDSQKQAWQFEVILGTNFLYGGGVRIKTTQVFTHPQWNPFNLNNDIAMIYLPTSAPISHGISTVSIPQIHEQWQTFVGYWATAAGFGKTTDQQQASSTVVSHVNLQVITVAQCQAVFNQPGLQYVVASTLCTSGWGGVGICGGDSGGPLVTNLNGRTVLIGVSSFVANNACQQGHPSAFARVTSFRNFINQHM